MSGCVIIKKASIEDAQEILSLQKLAYQSEAEIYSDYNIPPLVETLDGLKDNFKSHVFLKAMVNGKIVGSVRASEENETCYIGRLMVHPHFQNRGIGAKLLLEIEYVFPSCSRFELFTGHRSEKSIHLYEKLGYKTFKVEKVTDNLNLVFFEKVK
ncbi:MAG: GNAT family N-acetyltransferase [Candidatus Bathyarchaeia archaeon]|jgi:ribosomal protein S18 acetylase RimI-like enzyme